MAETAGEKTEKPTPKRLKEAKRNGDYLQSRELSTALVVMMGLTWLTMTGPHIMASIKQMLADGLTFGAQDINNFEPAERAYNLIGTVLWPVGIVIVACALASILAPLLLGSLHFNPGVFQPKFNKLNPISGLKRQFSMNGVIELGKSIIKIALIGTIGFMVLWHRLGAIRVMGKSGIHEAIGQVGSIFTTVVLTLGASLFILAAVDVPVQLIRRNKRLMMSKQEIKDEHKDQDGNPQIKQAIRNRAAKNLMEAMRKNMEGASVVLTNPTHFAVALRYHPGKDSAPVVVARGADDVAAAIRELAAEKSVPVLQYPELTRAIFYTSQVGHFIDERLFMAVATVLAFVFRIENKLASEMDRPHIELPDDMRFDSDGRKIVN
ncbi:MAG: EscU/YscU/HrcU family type III secretion system export apparatus switch protein [Sphingobium sp.]|nr:EscU/YscU/HrcU family type III secretion system export apparatus switch protein [Sphingobium sp.]